MFSVNDLQCGVVFHSGRNSLTKKQAMMECGEMLIEGSDYETEKDYNTTCKLLKTNPEEIMEMFQAEVFEHDKEYEECF